MEDGQAAEPSSTDLTIDRELLMALLEAALTTSKSYHGEETELYSLGALEATANFVYILAVQRGDDIELETICQEYAKVGLQRFEQLRG